MIHELWDALPDGANMSFLVITLGLYLWHKIKKHFEDEEK